MTEFIEDQNLPLHHGKGVIFTNIGADATAIAPFRLYGWLENGHRPGSGYLRMEKQVAIRFLDVAIKQGNRLARRCDGQGKIDGNRRFTRPAFSAGNGDLQSIHLILKKDPAARG